MNIYVGNLPKTATEDAVRKLFQAHGEVSGVTLIRDNFSGELRGFGFVEMPSKSDAQKAMKEVDGSELEGRTLVVNEARPRKERSSRGGGGGRQGGGGGYGGRGGGGGRSRSW